VPSDERSWTPRNPFWQTGPISICEQGQVPFSVPNTGRLYLHTSRAFRPKKAKGGIRFGTNMVSCLTAWRGSVVYRMDEPSKRWPWRLSPLVVVACRDKGPLYV
jgi:hypothetical protein